MGKGEPPVDPSEGEKELQRLKGSFSNTRPDGGGKVCAAYPGTDEQTSPKEERESEKREKSGWDVRVGHAQDEPWMPPENSDLDQWETLKDIEQRHFLKL